MKTIFKSNNGGKTILYILLGVAVLAFVALPFISRLLPEPIFLLTIFFTIICIMFLGGKLIDIRRGPPW
jgi:hypothetical protein